MISCPVKVIKNGGLVHNFKGDQLLNYNHPTPGHEPSLGGPALGSRIEPRNSWITGQWLHRRKRLRGRKEKLWYITLLKQTRKQHGSWVACSRNTYIYGQAHYEARTVCICEPYNRHSPIPGTAYTFFRRTFVSDHSPIPHIRLQTVCLFQVFVISLMGHVVYFSKLAVSGADDQLLQCVC